MGPPWRIDLMTHHTMSGHSYHGTTSRSSRDKWLKISETSRQIDPVLKCEYINSLVCGVFKINTPCPGVLDHSGDKCSNLNKPLAVLHCRLDGNAGWGHGIPRGIATSWFWSSLFEHGMFMAPWLQQQIDLSHVLNVLFVWTHSLCLYLVKVQSHFPGHWPQDSELVVSCPW